MRTHGKKYTAAAKNRDIATTYQARQALEIVKKSAFAKFDETVEVAIRLGVDPRHGDQMVRGTTSLPFGTGKARRVAVFAKGEKAQEAQDAGADVVGAEDLVEQIRNGWRDFDVLVAAPDMMSIVSRLGRTLGPRMPNPKSGTVTNDIARVVRDIKSASRVEYRVEKAGIIHMPIGKVSFPTDQLVSNFTTLLNALIKAKPQAAKGRYLRGITVSATMGPGFAIDTQVAQAMSERLGAAG
jgi:large subunit ribosomal protein L1